MGLHQATSLEHRSIPQLDRKKVWELTQAWENGFECDSPRLRRCGQLATQGMLPAQSV